MPSPPALNTPPAPPASPIAADTSQTGPGVEDQLAYRSEPAALGQVEWATAIDPETHQPRQPVESFSPDAPVIYGVIAVDRIAAGTTVQAKWTYNRTRLDTFDQSLVMESDRTNTWLEFHLALAQPGAWPSGQYDLNILVNGEPAVSGSVNVVAGP